MSDLLRCGALLCLLRRIGLDQPARRGAGFGIIPDSLGGVARRDLVAKFLRDAAERDEYRVSLKYRPCPHCGRVSFLICHGYLRGYSPDPTPIIRGFRFFCSNRHSRRGCGRTHSILLANVLPRRHTSALLLSLFLTAMLSCASVPKVWATLNVRLSLPTFNRLWHAFTFQMIEIRGWLSMPVLPPNGEALTGEGLLSNLRWTIRHLQAAFPGDNPVFAYQHHVQEPFLL